MRCKMKKSVLYIGILFLAVFVLHAFAHAQPDERLFQEAKILIFDKEWKKAQEKLEQLIDEYPDSPWFSQAVFYRAKCLKEQGGKERDALRAYQDYLKRISLRTLPGREKVLHVGDRKEAFPFEQSNQVFCRHSTESGGG